MFEIILKIVCAFTCYLFISSAEPLDITTLPSVHIYVGISMCGGIKYASSSCWESPIFIYLVQLSVPEDLNSDFLGLFERRTIVWWPIIFNVINIVPFLFHRVLIISTGYHFYSSIQLDISFVNLDMTYNVGVASSTSLLIYRTTPYNISAIVTES